MMSTRALCSVIKTIMLEPGTYIDVHVRSGLDLKTVRRLINELHDQGLVWISGQVKRDGKGRRSDIWSWQPSPFELADLPAPSKINPPVGDGSPLPPSTTPNS